jgi:hypothetical protein
MRRELEGWLLRCVLAVILTQDSQRAATAPADGAGARRDHAFWCRASLAPCERGRPAPLRERWHSAAGAGSVRAPCDAGRRRGRTTSGGNFSGASTMCGRLACLRRRAPCAMCVQCSLAARPVSCTAAAWTASLHDQRARARRLLAPRRTGRAGCTHAVGRHWPWSVRSRSLTATRRTVV